MVIYFTIGRSRIHRRGSQWAVYRITMGLIEISWPQRGLYGRGGTGPRTVRYKEVRRVSSHGLDDGRVDLELELLSGARLLLENLPQDVVTEMESIVHSFRARAEARRENMLRRYV